MNKHHGTNPTRRLAQALALVIGVTGAGTVGFVLIEKMSFFDSLYMTLVTISTLGMKAGQGEAMSGGGKFWVICLIIIGIASAMISLSIIVSVIVEGQMRSILGRRKVNNKIASLNNHIIVCGFGRMGRSVCDSLRKRNVNLVVIDNDDAKTTIAETEGYLYVLGDANDESTILDAGIERAQGMITVLDTDAANVFVTLIARDFNPNIKIAARAEKPESESRLRRAGASKVICPQVIGATRLANLLTRPGVVEFIDFASQGLDLEAEQYRITEGNKLIGQTLSQANLPRKIGVLIIAIKRSDGTTLFNPHPDTVLQVDDLMLLTGRTGSMAQLEKEYAS
ncbi:MAG: potassium channel protein [Phycisphaerae bacterium]|nr:potassium channel protein [Phycisphaerae bacterium]